MRAREEAETDREQEEQREKTSGHSQHVRGAGAIRTPPMLNIAQRLPDSGILQEHQNPVEGLNWKQVWELGFFVVPQALHRQ